VLLYRLGTLFLDVQMPDIDGFQVLAEIEGKASPLTIFEIVQARLSAYVLSEPAYG
jgi:CheY-like chemotaxis protein